MKYYAVYKCPLCGTMFRYGEPHEVPEQQLPELLAMVIKNQNFFGHPTLYTAPMHIPHKCLNGDAGLATFAGFKKIKTD